MAMNACEATEMLEEARKAERRIMINFSYRFRETSYALKGHKWDAGILGDIYFGRTVWHRRRGITKIRRLVWQEGISPAADL